MVVQLKEFTTVKYFLLLTPTKLEGSRLVWVSIDVSMRVFGRNRARLRL